MTIHSITTAIVIPLAALLLSAVACGSSESNSETDRREEACSRYCDKLEMCNSNTDEPQCNEDCADNRATSADVFERVANCTEDLSCNQLIVLQPQLCIAEAVEEVPLSAAGAAFCEDYAAGWEACNSLIDEANVKAECEDVAGAFTADYLAALRQCLDESCNDVSPCFEQTSEDFSINYVVPFF